MRTQFALIAILLSSIFAAGSAMAQGLQKKVDLEDVKIRGEANGNGMSIIAKSKNSLDGRIKVRNSFKEEIVSELPEGIKSDFFEDQKK